MHEDPGQVRPAKASGHCVGRRRLAPLEGPPVVEVGGRQKRDQDAADRPLKRVYMGETTGLFDQRPVAAGAAAVKDGAGGGAALSVGKAEERRPVAEGGREEVRQGRQSSASSGRVVTPSPSASPSAARRSRRAW